MLSVAKIQEYMQEAIELFEQEMPLPTPDISFAVATKSKLNKVVEEQTKLVGTTPQRIVVKGNGRALLFQVKTGLLLC